MFRRSSHEIIVEWEKDKQLQASRLESPKDAFYTRRGISFILRGGRALKSEYTCALLESRSRSEESPLLRTRVCSSAFSLTFRKVCEQNQLDNYK